MTDEHKMFAIAKSLLDLKESDSAISYIVRREWRRQAITLIVQIALIYLFWSGLSESFLGYFVIGLLVGRISRDLVWHYVMSKQWKYRKDLIDWPKVEQIVMSAQSAS